MPCLHWTGIFKNTFFSLQFKKEKNPCTHQRYFKIISSTSSTYAGCQEMSSSHQMVWCGRIILGKSWENVSLRDILAPCPNWEMGTDKILLIPLLVWGIEQILCRLPDWFLWIFCVDKSRSIRVFSVSVKTQFITSLWTLNRTNKCSVVV